MYFRFILCLFLILLVCYYESLLYMIYKNPNKINSFKTLIPFYFWTILKK